MPGHRNGRLPWARTGAVRPRRRMQADRALAASASPARPFQPPRLGETYAGLRERSEEIVPPLRSARPVRTAAWLPPPYWRARVSPNPLSGQINENRAGTYFCRRVAFILQEPSCLDEQRRSPRIPQQIRSRDADDATPEITNVAGDISRKRRVTGSAAIARSSKRAAFQATAGLPRECSLPVVLPGHPGRNATAIPALRTTYVPLASGLFKDTSGLRDHQNRPGAVLCRRSPDVRP